MTDFLKVVVRERRPLTSTIVEFTLVAEDGRTLPPAEAGAHIAVKTPSKAVRRYSLTTPDPSPELYRIAVKREPLSRGGSASMHDTLAIGDLLEVEPPVNDFPLVEAPDHLLIAGGIGVTPILSMARTLTAAGKPPLTIYCAREPDEAAYVEELSNLLGDRLIFHEDGGEPGRLYDFWDHFETPRRAHVYCCGPAPLMEEIRALSGHWPEGAVHFEDFKPTQVIRSDDKAFDVILASTGQRFTVPADRSILEALRDAGVTTRSSCESGTCGTCRTKLIAGDVDHRDMVLMEDERADQIMICVSRASGEELTLDL